MKSSDAKQRMLLSAVRLFRKQGYERTSMLDVVRDSGAPRGSLYHYFPGGKADLGRQAVTLASGAVLAWIQGAHAASDSAPDFVRRLGAAYGRALEESSFEEGCPLATVALETAPAVPELAETCRIGFASWVDEVAQALEGFGHAEARARALAIHAVSAIEGALILSRAEGNTAPLEAVVALLESLVEPTDG